MEFPDLGQHCSQESCKQLDFLPVKCDACLKIFCNEHFRYEQHSCPESFRKDNQVPVCPLCNTPISVKKGQPPDLVVGQHIDNDCHQKKKTSNKCNVKGCKQKELIPVVCDKCRKNYCLRHRLGEDHNCQGFEGSGRGISNAGAAALTRVTANSGKSNGPFKSQGKPQQTTLSSVGASLNRERQERQMNRTSGVTHASSGRDYQALQAGMSEDEAMARALAMSINDSQTTNHSSSQNTTSDASKKTQEENDLALARALQQSEEEARRNRNRPTETARQTSRDKSCAIS